LISSSRSKNCNPLLLTRPPVVIVLQLCTKKQELLYNDIEKLMKAFKGHLCALDFDSGFVNLQLKEAKKVA
jgi:hypothetical protein